MWVYTVFSVITRSANAVIYRQVKPFLNCSNKTGVVILLCFFSLKHFVLLIKAVVIRISCSSCYLFIIAMIAHLKCHSPTNRREKTLTIYMGVLVYGQDYKALKVFLNGFVFMIHLQISRQETESEKRCCDYLLYLQSAWGRTAHWRWAELYDCPLACLTQISIYGNSAWNMVTVYHRRIQNNNLKPQAGCKEPVFGKTENECKTMKRVVIKMLR